jgi:hypothetical protein
MVVTPITIINKNTNLFPKGLLSMLLFHPPSRFFLLNLYFSLIPIKVVGNGK